MSSYYFVGQTITGNSGVPVSGSTGTFTGNVTVGGTLVVTGATTAPSFTISPASGALNWAARAQLFSPADGVVQVLNAAGTDTTGTTGFLVGLSTNGGGFRLTSQSGVASRAAFRTGDNSAQASVLMLNAILPAGGTVGDINGNGLIFTSSTVSTLNTNLAFSGAAPIVNFTSALGALATFQNNGTAVATLDKGGNLVPSIGDPSTYYQVEDFNGIMQTTSFAQNGNTGFGVNSVTAPLYQNSTQGVIYCNTTSTTQGGYFATFGGIPLLNSGSIIQQWRFIFYVPAASTGANRYTAFYGAFSPSGSAINTNTGPFAGPYVAYSDNLNSGNWVLGSACNNTRTTTNSAVAVTTNAWHNMTITLNGGIYTYVMDGVTLGTVTDANLPATPQNNIEGNLGGIMILPDGTNFTTIRYAMLDRCDYYVTGLTR